MPISTLVVVSCSGLASELDWIEPEGATVVVVTVDVHAVSAKQMNMNLRINQSSLESPVLRKRESLLLRIRSVVDPVLEQHLHDAAQLRAG